MHEDTPSVDFHSKIAENNYIIILSSTIAHTGRASPHMPRASEHKTTQQRRTLTPDTCVALEIVAVADKKPLYFVSTRSTRSAATCVGSRPAEEEGVGGRFRGPPLTNKRFQFKKSEKNSIQW